jgi:subtilisin family serine protease
MLALAAALAPGAQAVAQLPQLPQTPAVQLPPLPDAARAAESGLRDLAGLRALRAERLVRRHRAELDRDPRGEPVIRAQVLAVDITEAALERATQARFRPLRTEALADLGLKITVLQTPEGMSASRGLKRLRKLDPQGIYDFNHVYLDSGTSATTSAAKGAAQEGHVTGGGVRVGLIDGGVDATHVSLRANVIHATGCGDSPVPSAHGTAVASLLAGASGEFRGAAPRAELFAADVYCGRPTGGAVDGVAAAFAWLVRQRVAVINVSLVGPRNALLERVVAALVARGHLIVAAVGNDGPASPPLYPAAYDGVLAVTAVDQRHRVLLEACRGRHLDVAARGADLRAAISGEPENFSTVRGTSFAAPLVAGLLAAVLREPDVAARDRAVSALLSAAEDLGARGRDDVYGAGLVGADPGTVAAR